MIKQEIKVILMKYDRAFKIIISNITKLTLKKLERLNYEN